MRTRSLALIYLVCSHAAGAQSSNDFVQSLRAYAQDLGERLVFAAYAMPEEHLKDRPAPGTMSFREILLDVARQNDRNCAIIVGTKPPPRQALPAGSGKGAIISRLEESFSFCNTEFRSIDDGQLAQPAIDWDWEYVTGLQRTRGFVATQTIAFWTSRYTELEIGLRQNGLVPPRICIGGGDCNSGENLCRTTASPRIGGKAALIDSASSVRSDGRGMYVNAVANATVELGVSAALIFTALHDANIDSIRAFRVDLSKPVPGGGGVPLGVLRVPERTSDNRASPAVNDLTGTRSTYASIFAQWYAEPNENIHGVSDIPIGTTVNAEQLDVNLTIDGAAHVLQMGPQPMWHCYSDRPAIHGAGTTRAAISHPTAAQWIIDLPRGSIGRLWDVHLLPANAVDKGLYFVSLRLVIDQ